MPVVTDKYRGTTTYQQVYAELITAARFRGTVTYQELAQIMGIALIGAHMGQVTGHILGEISEDEHARGRPMLSAVAVGVSGTPGSGFFDLARQLGKLQEESAQAQRAFWEGERDAVFATWRRKLSGGQE